LLHPLVVEGEGLPCALGVQSKRKAELPLVGGVVPTRLSVRVGVGVGACGLVLVRLLIPLLRPLEGLLRLVLQRLGVEVDGLAEVAGLAVVEAVAGGGGGEPLALLAAGLAGLLLLPLVVLHALAEAF